MKKTQPPGDFMQGLAIKKSESWTAYLTEFQMFG